VIKGICALHNAITEAPQAVTPFAAQNYVGGYNSSLCVVMIGIRGLKPG